MVVLHSIELKAIMQAHSFSSVSLKEILHALPESVYCKNVEGVYIVCSQRMAEMAGCSSPDEIVGKTDYDLIWHAHANELRANDLRVMESGQALSFEERGHTALKEVMVVRTVKSPLYDEQGKIVGIVGISFDVTDLLYNPTGAFQKFAAESAIQRAESTFLKEWYQEVSGQEITQSL